MIPGMTKRPQSNGEEIANSVSHGVGCVMAIVSVPFLVLAASRRSGPALVGAAIFGATTVALYLISTLYHALPLGRGKRVFRVLDHSGIYLLIAGTYTPFTLGILRGVWGWLLFAIVWLGAVAGIAMKAIGGIRFSRLSTVFYMIMGWAVLVAIRPLWGRMPVSGWWWLLAGGAAYSAGVAFYAGSQRVRYAHFVWHLFVVAGTACHYVAVLWYAN